MPWWVNVIAGIVCFALGANFMAQGLRATPHTKQNLSSRAVQCSNPPQAIMDRTQQLLGSGVTTETLREFMALTVGADKWELVAGPSPVAWLQTINGDREKWKYWIKDTDGWRCIVS